MGNANALRDTTLHPSATLPSRSLRVTRSNLSGGTHVDGWPARAAASLSISLKNATAGATTHLESKPHTLCIES